MFYHVALCTFVFANISKACLVYLAFQAASAIHLVRLAHQASGSAVLWSSSLVVHISSVSQITHNNSLNRTSRLALGYETRPPHCAAHAAAIPG